MENENTDVNPEEMSDPQEDIEGSEPVENTDVVDREVYEKVREDMKSERKAKREAQAKLKELEERTQKLEQTRRRDGDPRLDVLYLVNKDSFVKENIDLIEQKMEDNPEMDVYQAVSSVKAELFDKIQKEISKAEPNQPLKQEKPTATQEQTKPELTGDVLKDALAGKLENVDPGQLEAVKRVLGK